MFEVTISPRARRDLIELLDYIREHNLAAAERFGHAILDHIALLATFPRLGAPVESRPGVRKLLHTPVRIYYRIDERRRQVQILHLRHAARRDPKL